jgi:hypothetical protein
MKKIPILRIRFIIYNYSEIIFVFWSFQKYGKIKFWKYQAAIGTIHYIF